MSNPFCADASPCNPYAPLSNEAHTQSILPEDLVIAGCGPGRIEKIVSLVAPDGKTHTLLMRDKPMADDWLESQMRAVAHARRRSEPFLGLPPSSRLRDDLLRTHAVP